MAGSPKSGYAQAVLVGISAAAGTTGSVLEEGVGVERRVVIGRSSTCFCENDVMVLAFSVAGWMLGFQS